MEVIVEREVERVPKFYLFGHYDSRGGATGVIARNHLAALRAYAETFHADSTRDYVRERGGVDAGERAYDNIIDEAADEFIARYELRVADEALPDDGVELLAEYEGAGYSFGVVQTRYRRVKHAAVGGVVDGNGLWSRWADTAVAVIWKGRQPKLRASPGVLDEQVRLDRRNVGEDAFGLVLRFARRDRV